VIRFYEANKFAKFGIFEVFWVQKSPYINRSTWNLAWRRRVLVSFDVPNLVIIGGTCRPMQAKNRKIVPWVILIPTLLPVIMTNMKSTTGFAMNELQTECVQLPLSLPKSGSKSDFLFFNKIQFQLN